MKRTLLFTAIACMTVFGVNAQTVWNFGEDATNFPLYSGVPAGTTVNILGLSITAGTSPTNMGAITSSSKSFGTYNFVNRFQFNGGGYTGAAVGQTVPSADGTTFFYTPTQRYISFSVSGLSTIKAIGITGSNNTTRLIFVTDGTNLIGTFKYYGTALVDSTVTYSGPAATTLYMFCNAACNLYYLSATSVITSLNQVLSDQGVSFNGTEITNSKGLALEVYNVLGKKVASSMTSIPTVNFQKGIYIVRASGMNNSLKICI